MSIRLIYGDCRDMLSVLPAESVHCCVTSPPYWGLRDYGTAQWDGGDAACDHRMPAMGTRDVGRDRSASNGKFHDSPVAGRLQMQFPHSCGHCGAIRIDRQIGLEPTPDAYVATLVEVFRAVRRVLRADGTAWLNLGDSYAGASQGNPQTFSEKQKSSPGTLTDRVSRLVQGLKSKDLIGIPWRVAFALQADGWYLRSDIIWAKPNPMPESVTDRPTKAHEYLFLLAKSERYYYDAAAIAEPAIYAGDVKNGLGSTKDFDPVRQATVPRGIRIVPDTRNRRSVWTVATQPYTEAHFATFPPALIEPCILAGCPERICAKCNAPWVQDVQVVSRPNVSGPEHRKQDGTYYRNYPGNHGVGGDRRERTGSGGFVPSCVCGAAVVPGTVLDPFGGAGTTGLVADRLQRNAVLIELNPKYSDMAERRIVDDGPLFADIRKDEQEGNDGLATLVP